MNRPNIKNYVEHPVKSGCYVTHNNLSYAEDLEKYIDYLEAKFNNVDLGSVSICDIDHCSKPSENETDAGNLCEKHYDDYFQALDNASVC